MDRDHRRDQGQHAGGLGLAGLGEAADRVQADEQRRDRQHGREDQSGHALEALVPVGVLAVGVPGGDAQAEHHDQTAEHVGGRVHRVADHGGRVGQQARQKLEGAEQDVQPDADVVGAFRLIGAENAGQDHR